MDQEPDRERLKRIAKALGDVRLYDKHHTGELVAMRLRDSLADHPGYDAEAVEAKLLELAKAALEAAG
ncbi:hypothetical protein [Azospirillum agricola]|uniref:hypothetical protein n=1 Tax=Azospirillum agricola TaxID=1720247 RepID=UPI000A0F2FCE|nr:hypothetical protein [Azospirillum agricola]SMH58567.1 hypothetical protein SAMN02982994_4677 [Azospirillum lipoferum]